jgi:hypothetical protein
MNNITVVNSKIQKNPHNINIKNFNPNEPKIKSNLKYSNKQNYHKPWSVPLQVVVDLRPGQSFEAKGEIKFSPV